MSDEIRYDAFLSYASEDGEWAARLADRLRDAGVRVWFDQWKIEAGDNLLARLNEGLAQSRKLIAVWTPRYFAEQKVWTRAEAFSQQHQDVLASQRPLIPVLRAPCQPLPTLATLVSLDFQNDDDFDLSVRQLVNALDIPAPPSAEPDELAERFEHELDPGERGRRAHLRGHRFEDEVATLYRLLGWEVTQDVQLDGMQIDLQIRKHDGGLDVEAIVECKNKQVDAADRDQILAQQNLAQKKLPAHRWIAVSSQGFAGPTRTALTSAGVSCVTYRELLRELVPLDSYVEHLIADYEETAAQNWNGGDWFIRPNLERDITYERQPAVEYPARWLGDDRSNLLVVLGDLGTGKTTLARFLSYQLARSFRDDPLRHPAPVLIPLKEVRKEVSLEGMIVSHFSRMGLPGVSFPRFEHLVQAGRVLVLFDAFDEMADRVRWDVTKSNFAELRRAAERGGKVILSCRTHYFKDRDEQVRLIGQGPKLSEIETELYRELQQQRNAEVVFLREFSDEQIRTYLQHARPDTVDEDWQKIEEIHNLRELAQRPLLLEMIVRSLPKLDQGETINAASLYKVYTSFWLDREEKKGRILDAEMKLKLMLELSRRMWHGDQDAIHYRDLVPFVEQLAADKSLQLDDEESQDVAREMQTATFLKWKDDAGNFAFVHRSFMEYFLACVLYERLLVDNEQAARGVLDTRLLDRKVIYFLTLLDQDDRIAAPLQQILTSSYTPRVSENALQVLYWSVRIRAGMEEQIADHDGLRQAMAVRLPAAMQLAGGDLQGMVLEAAVLTDVNLAGAQLGKLNLNHARLTGGSLVDADLSELRGEALVASNVDLRNARFKPVTLTDGHLDACDLRGTKFDEADFVGVQVERCLGIAGEETAPAVAEVAARVEDLVAVVQLGFPSGVRVVRFSPDGRLLAAVGDDGVVWLYLADSETIYAALDFGAAAGGVGFAPQLPLLASASSDHTVRLWNVESGKNVRVLEGHSDAVNAVHFAPQRPLLASASDDKTVRLWNVESGKNVRVLEGHSSTVTAVHFAPQRPLLASASHDETVRLWNVESGKNVRVLEGHSSTVTAVHFAPQRPLLASASLDKTVRLWNVDSGKNVRVLEGHSNVVTAVHFAPQLPLLASASHDKTVRLSNVDSGKNVRVLEGHSNGVTAVHFDPQLPLLASASFDHTVRLWNVDSGKNVRVLKGHSNGVTAVHFDPQLPLLASASFDHTVRLSNVDSGKNVRVLEGHKHFVTAVHFAPQRPLLASASFDKTVRLWNVESGKNVRVLEGHSDWVRAVHFAPQRPLLASAGSDKTVRLWNVESGKNVRVLEGHSNGVNAVHFAPQLPLLASASYDKTVRLWNVESGKNVRVLEGHKHFVNAVHFAPQLPLLASASDDKTVRLWNVESEEHIRVLEGHSNGVTAVHFALQRPLLASASYDKTVRLWNVESGECVAVLRGHLGQVRSVCFSPNGRYLIAAGVAGRLQYWDVETHETFLYRYSFGPGAWLDLLPDGRFDASPEGMRYLRYSQMGAYKSYPAEQLAKHFYQPDAVREVLAPYLKPADDKP